MHYVVLFDPGYATVYVDDTVGRCAIVVCENKIHFQSRLVATFPSIDTHSGTGWHHQIPTNPSAALHAV